MVPRDDDDEALPWLEPAEVEDDEDDRGGTFPFRGLIVASATVVAVVAGLWVVADRFGEERTVAASGEVPLIQAPEGPYKVRPDDPGGLDVDTDSLTHAVAEGLDPSSQVALDVVPEEPVPIPLPQPTITKAPVPAPQTPDAAASATKRPPTPQPKIPVTPAPKQEPAAPKPSAPKAEPKVEPVAVQPKPAPATPAPVLASGSATVQLGAFNSEATANQVWAKLGGIVGSYGKSVQPVDVGGRTLYRLRATGVADAGALCARVQAAGEQCAVVR